MPSSSARVLFAEKREARTLQARATDAGLNVDAREIGGGVPRPSEVKVYGRHSAGVSITGLCEGLDAQITDLVTDPND